MSAEVGALLARLRRRTLELAEAAHDADPTTLAEIVRDRGDCLDALRTALGDDDCDEALRAVAREVLESTRPIEELLETRLRDARDQLSSIREARERLREGAVRERPRFVSERV